MLNQWGYEVVPDPDKSRWNEIVRNSPMTGLVLIRAEKRIEDTTFVFRITEYWEDGTTPGRTIRENASLVRYHYHGQTIDATGAPRAGVRFCLFEERHMDIPFHRHPGGGQKVEPYEPIDPWAALAEFEAQVFLDAGGSAEPEGDE